MRYDVFISYSREDHDQAMALQDQFQARGLTAFVAPRQISGGARWRNEIRSGISESREFVVLASKASLTSDWVLAECGAAWGFDKRITPVLIDVAPDSLPAWLEEYHCSDLNKIDELITHLAGNRGRVKRFSSGIARELQLVEVKSGEVKPLSESQQYEILQGQLNLADSETTLWVDFRITGSGSPRVYKLVGRGPSATSFADLHYKVYEGDRLAWGGVMCLYVAAPLNGAWRGYWVARADTQPGHVYFGSLEVREP